MPRRNSLISLPEYASHTRSSVPRAEVVASRRPEGTTERAVSAVVCAAMIEIEFLNNLIGDRKSSKFCAGDATEAEILHGGR